MINIEIASFKQHSNAELNKLYKIVIKGYQLTEKEVWGENYVRISQSDYALLIRKGEVLMAKLNGEVVGGIHYYPLDKHTYTFSLLASNFDFAGKGVGTALITAVESEAKKNGATHIKMEVLRVRGLDTDCKLRLDYYYKKLGYNYTHSKDCICKIPLEKYQKLQAPSDFDFYSKELI